MNRTKSGFAAIKSKFRSTPRIICSISCNLIYLTNIFVSITICCFFDTAKPDTYYFIT